MGVFWVLEGVFFSCCWLILGILYFVCIIVGILWGWWLDIVVLFGKFGLFRFVILVVWNFDIGVEILVGCIVFVIKCCGVVFCCIKLLIFWLVFVIDLFVISLVIGIDKGDFWFKDMGIVLFFFNWRSIIFCWFCWVVFWILIWFVLFFEVLI